MMIFLYRALVKPDNFKALKNETTDTNFNFLVNDNVRNIMIHFIVFNDDNQIFNFCIIVFLYLKFFLKINSFI